VEQTGLAPSSQSLPPVRSPLLDFQFEPSMTSHQARAARGLVNWSVRELAEAAGVSPMTVKRIEASDGVLSVRDRSAKAVRVALERAGVEFVFTAGTEPGVRPRG
jgi:transcriptional regulator with XRE-family HTH domain